MIWCSLRLTGPAPLGNSPKSPGHLSCALQRQRGNTPGILYSLTPDAPDDSTPGHAPQGFVDVGLASGRRVRQVEL